MARPPKGKPLTLRPIRLDDDVWAECQRLGKEHGTINEGIAAAFARAKAHIADGWQPVSAKAGDVLISVVKPLPRSSRTFKGPIPKPKDKKR